MNYRFGMNDHDLLWASAADQARVAADLQALGATIHRCDVPIDQPVTAPIASWAQTMRAVGIQPMIVATWTSAIPANAAGIMAGLAKANPGIWWEFGNEWESQQGGPTQVRANGYVIVFAQVVSAMKAADPTCKISPNPVANINVGGWGWTWTEQTFAAFLAQIPYDMHDFHGYSYPNNLPWPNPYLDSATFTAQAIAWGCKVPFGWSECGWQSSGNGMTPALQVSQMTAFLQAIPSNIPVVIAYELSDGGGEFYGWYNTVGSDYYNNPKPVYAAVQALLKPAPAPNYQSLYQAAIAQIQSVGVNQPTQWLAANPGQPARTYLASLAGKNAAWLKGHPAS